MRLRPYNPRPELALTPGTSLGVYEVTAKIGEGGMGQVYRARDTRLHRDVALKILPDAVAGDPDRLARFTREAQTLASLNHPNIAHIHGFEESGGVRALVMELVEGEDLSQRIARGAIPISEALPTAKQIAEALEAAHEQGIIHRDLKPANIKVREDGTVKVLDFGLAKALEPTSAASSNVSQSPTITTPAMTQAGMILGTAAYMSPEQAKGRAADRRSDVWAFGVVLYEMLTGQRAFKGEDVPETLAFILTRQPDWTALPADTPPLIRRLLRRCLEKERKRRLDSAADARLEIEEALTGPSAVEAAAAQPETALRSAWSRALTWTLAASTLGLAIALVPRWAPWRSETGVDRPLVRLDVDLGADVSLLPVTESAAGSSVAISPDGMRLAYASGTPPRLFTRRLDQPNATELPGTQNASAPFFSPDGQWIGWLGIGKANKIAVEGGAIVPLPLGDAGFTVGGASWGEDGSILVATRKGLVRISEGGDRPETVAALANGEVALDFPQILPGGKAVLFSAYTAPNADASSIEVMTLADRHRKTVSRGGTSPRYLATSNGEGHLVYVNKTTLFAVPFDVDTLETRGTALPVVEDVAFNAAWGTAQLAFSRTGTLVYRKSGDDTGLLTVVWLDGAGTMLPLLAKAGVYARPALSPDGQRMALDVTEGSGTDIWVYDWQRDTMTRVTFTGRAENAVWSQDGRYIMFRAIGEGMAVTRSDGAGKAQTLTHSKNAQYPRSFTPDGKQLTFEEIDPRTRFDIWTVPLESEGAGLRAGKPEVFLQTVTSERSPALSPDGRWLTYSSDESGTHQVYVRAFPDQGGKWQISKGGGTYPMWARDGHELLFETLDRKVMAATYTVKGDSFVADKPRLWSDRQLGGPNQIRNAAISPDGNRIAALMPAASSKGAQPALNHVVFLENFFDELRRRVPVGR
ncbi:MAG: protein kinase domain-containing protein [Vicinamibacterales bacterium]